MFEQLSDVFGNLTHRARHALGRSREVALSLKQEVIGPEHLLLALAEVSKGGVAGQALQQAGVVPAQLRRAVEALGGVGRSDRAAPQLPFTPSAKRALELAAAETARVGQAHIGTEHLLLGVLSSGDHLANQALKDLTVVPGRLYNQVCKLLGVAPGEGVEEAAKDGAAAPSPPLPDDPMVAVLTDIRDELRRIRRVLEHRGS